MINPKQKKLLTGLNLILILLVLSLLVIAERQNIFDWYALRGYHPPTAIAQLATQDGMKAYTKRVYYVNHPELNPKTTFSSNCPNISVQNVVLGCYHSGQQGIFILAVNNSQLYGIEQVTAAYETLHAVYQRLSSSAQSQLNSELVSFEDNKLSDPIIKAQIANFRLTEPGEVLNEMTSLFGTEVQNLSPALNTFYSQYFSNRQTIVNFYNNYQSAFTSRQQQISAYDAQLSSLNIQIKSDEATLASELSQLNQEQTSLTSDRTSGLITEYNQLVGQYNQQADQYNILADTVRASVTQYNQIVSSRNSIVLVEQQLVQSISSPSSVRSLN